MALLLENEDERAHNNLGRNKKVCSCFDKRRQLYDGVSSGSQALIRREASVVENTTAPERNVMEGLVGGSAIDELTKMVGDLQIFERWWVLCSSSTTQVRIEVLVVR